MLTIVLFLLVRARPGAGGEVELFAALASSEGNAAVAGDVVVLDDIRILADRIIGDRVETRNELAGAIVLVAFEIIITIRCGLVSGWYGGEVDILPFKVGPGAGAILLDIVKFLDVMSIPALCLELLSVILRDVSEQAILILHRMLWFPKVVVSTRGILLVEIAHTIVQSGEIEVDGDQVLVFAAPEEKVLRRITWNS